MIASLGILHAHQTLKIAKNFQASSVENLREARNVHSSMANQMKADRKESEEETNFMKIWLVTQIHQMAVEDEDYRMAAYSKKILEAVSKRTIK